MPGSTQHRVLGWNRRHKLKLFPPEKKKTCSYKYQRSPWYSARRRCECQGSIIYAARETSSDPPAPADGAATVCAAIDWSRLDQAGRPAGVNAGNRSKRPFFFFTLAPREVCVQAGSVCQSPGGAGVQNVRRTAEMSCFTLKITLSLSLRAAALLVGN